MSVLVDTRKVSCLQNLLVCGLRTSTTPEATGLVFCLKVVLHTWLLHAIALLGVALLSITLLHRIPLLLRVLLGILLPTWRPETRPLRKQQKLQFTVD